MQELHCILSGRVQGVAFRNFIRSIALELGLTGFVSNLPDGSLEVFAQGKYQVLKVFMNHLSKGPPGAQVTGLYDDWRDEPTKEFQGFQIM
jgi:acylphosphatase